MKKLFLILWLCSFKTMYCQELPITDTIQAPSWQAAMDLTFGLLPKEHYPSNYLLNKATANTKMLYANGTLNDSTFNMLEFYFIQNAARMAYNTPDSIKNYFYIDSIKNNYIDHNNILPFGMIDINTHAIKDSAFIDGSISVLSYRLIENTSNLSKIYKTTKLFCIAPLNLEVLTLNPQFIIKPEFIFSNNTNKITAIDVDLDDDLGYKRVGINESFQASYSEGGYKLFTTRISYGNGDTLYSRSELYVVDNTTANRLAQSYVPYDDVYTEFITIPQSGGQHVNYIYPPQFIPSLQGDRYAEVGIWYGCNNDQKKIRKPFIIFAGYNTKNGKSLKDNGKHPWANKNLGAFAVDIDDSFDGWRGPLYETYNGFFTDGSKNAAGGQDFGDNANHFLDYVRNEGYDIVIVRFHDGIGYLQTTAFLATIVLKNINKKIVSEVDNVKNYGAALDPEAPDYPNTTKIKRAKHELIVAGYSAGALSGRMALLLMELENDLYKCDNNKTLRETSTNHRTKIWIGIDHECQGSNMPMGQQMFMDFQQSVAFFPANAVDIANSLVNWFALRILQKKGVPTQNTLYHLDNMFNVGADTWNVGHHQDFDDYFADLERITPKTYPANLNGYPKNCYRISASQGNADGIEQLFANNPTVIYNQSPSSWCVNPWGTFFGIGGGGIIPIKVTPFREAHGRVLTSTNTNAFDCKFGVSLRTFVYNWHINIGHWKYHKHNYIQDRYQNSLQLYDIAAGSTLPSHILLKNGLFASLRNPALAAASFCNLKDWNVDQSGFAPTVSGLDLHTPGNNALPRLPNLSLIPGNVSGGLNLMYQNKRTSNPTSNPSPSKDFGFPHLTFPDNHYDYTPYDAIWANTTNDKNYNFNTIHVEDPNPLMGVFLLEEIAPKTLYLSNRTIIGQYYKCERTNVMIKYYADFEARNSVLVGNQSIYEHETPDYERVRSTEGDFIIDTGAVVTIRANNDNRVSSITLGAGFSSKHGSIFRAYVYGDDYCLPVIYAKKQITSNNSSEQTQREPRPIKVKLVNTKTHTNNEAVTIALYPNPTTGSIYYELKDEASFNYTLTDIAGKVLEIGTINANNKLLQLNQYKAGVYILTINNANYSQTNRIILK